MHNQPAAEAPAWTRYIPHLAILGLAAGLRFYRLDGPSLWLDEVLYTWGLLQVSWSDFLKTFHFTGVQLPFYFSLTKIISPWFASPELGLRVLSAAVDTLAVLVAMAVGRAAGGRDGGLAGGLFAGWYWAFNPWLVWYAREARPYALSATLSLLLLWIFLRLWDGAGVRAWVAAFLVLLVGLFTHYFYFLFSGLLIFLALADIRANPGFFRRWTSLSLAAYLPLGAWIYWFLSQPNPTLGIGWIDRPDLLDLPLTVWNLASGYGGQLHPASALFGATVVALAVIGLRGPVSEPTLPRISFLGACLALIAVWIVSQRRPIYMDRYFITLAAILLLPASAGAARTARWIRRRWGESRFPAWGRGVFMAAMLAIGVWAAWGVHAAPGYAREDWRGLAEVLSSRHTSGQQIWLSDVEAVLPLTFYQAETGQVLSGGEPPACPAPCWWVLRQPYTETHAFAQGISDPDRPWKPDLSEGCQVTERWESPTGLALWQVTCGQAGTD